MAILFITHKFPPSIGGMQKQSYELINGIRKSQKIYTIIQSPLESKFWFFLRLKSRIKKMIRNHSDIEIIHCNDGVVAAMCTWLLRYDNLKITTTLHGLDISFPNQIFQKFVVPKLRRFHKVFVVSDATAKACYERGFSLDQVETIYNGVELNDSPKTLNSQFLNKLNQEHGIDLINDKVLLSIGRPVKRKGFLWFTKNVLNQLPSDYKYIVVGPSDNNIILSWIFKVLPAQISNQIKLALGYPDDAQLLQKIKNSSFHYLNMVKYDELVQLILHAKLVLMPNVKVTGDMEGFGLVALEAAEKGTFVVASDIEGITSAVKHDKNGLLLPSRDAPNWLNTIKMLCENKSLLSAKSRYARAFVRENYGWDKMILSYLNAFNTLRS